MEMRDALSLPVQYGSPPPGGRTSASAPLSLHASLPPSPEPSHPGWDFEQQLPGQLAAPAWPQHPEQQQEQMLQARLRAQQLRLQQQRAEQEAWAAAARALLVRRSGGRQLEQQAAPDGGSMQRDTLPQHSAGSSSGQPCSGYPGRASLPPTPGTHGPLPPTAPPAAHAALGLPEREASPAAAQQAQQAAKLAALQRAIGQLQAEIVDLESAERLRVAQQAQQAQQTQQAHLAAELAKQREWELKRRQWEGEQALQAALARQQAGGSPARADFAAAAAGRQHLLRERQVELQSASGGQPQRWGGRQAPELHARDAAHLAALQQPLRHQAEMQLLQDQRARLHQAWLRLQAEQQPSPARGSPGAASPPGAHAACASFEVGSCPARLSGPWPQQPGFLPHMGRPHGSPAEAAAAGRGDLGDMLLTAPALDLALADQPGRAMSLDLDAAPSFETMDLLELNRELSQGGMPTAVSTAPCLPPSAAAPSPPGSASLEDGAPGGSGCVGLEFRPPPAATQPLPAVPQGWWGPLATQGQAQA